MKPVTIKKIERSQLNVLQSELHTYYDQIMKDNIIQNFYDAIIYLDIINSLHWKLTSRLHNQTSFFNLHLSSSEAAVILKCVLNNQNTEPYAVSFFEKIKELIDKQLKSLI